MRSAKRKAIANLFDKVDANDSDLDEHNNEVGQSVDNEEHSETDDNDLSEVDDNETAPVSVCTSPRDLWKKTTFQPHVKEFDLQEDTSSPDHLPSEIDIK